jgi:L-ascorbate metabolism protein UlaG (beta-lactamase superfamily)
MFNKIEVTRNSFCRFVFSAFLLVIMGGCDQVGENPKDVHLKIVQSSPNYDMARKKFVNRRADIMENMGDDTSFWDDPIGRLRNNFFINSNETSPSQLIPEDRSGVPADFADSAGTVKFIWLGHSTFLLSINNKIVLVDPIFSAAASPVSFLVKRFQPPVINIDELPELDYVLISHDHYDHLDMETIIKLKDDDVTFVAPLGVGSHMRKWGVDNDKLIELDWWDEIDFDGVTFICTPAQHFSGRMALFSTMQTLWASWIVKGGGKSVYYSGDSGYDVHYKDIGERYGAFDIVFMDSGQYNERWAAVHNMPDEVIQGFIDLEGRHLVPVHWGMFTLSLHNWYDPPSEITKRAEKQGISVMTPLMGQTVILDNPGVFERWWEALINVKDG